MRLPDHGAFHPPNLDIPNLIPDRLAWVKSALSILLPLRSAPERLAWRKLQPFRSQSDRLAPDKLAYMKFPERLRPDRSHPDRFSPYSVRLGVFMAGRELEFFVK